MPTSLVATFVAVFAAGVVASAASHAAFVASPQFSSVDRELRRSSALLLQKLPVSKDDGDRTRGCAGNGAAVTSRRDALQAAAASSLSGALLLLLLLPLSPEPARAGIDPSALVNLPVEGDASGTATRLRQIEATRNRPEDAVDVPFVELPSGASYREYREGKGEAVVKEGSKVAVEMTARCRSFSTAQEPGGLKYFSTKDDTDFNELAWTVGSGALLPGLEEVRTGALDRFCL